MVQLYINLLQQAAGPSLQGCCCRWHTRKLSATALCCADRSAEYVKLLLPAVPAALPSNLEDLKAYLRDQGRQRIPVTPVFFQVRTEMPFR